jgi:hypothetical protein
LQFRKIGDAAKVAGPGDTVLIHGGVYRESVAIARSGTTSNEISFQAATGERVVVTGADRLIDWKKESESESIYSTPWPYAFIGWSKDHSYAARAPIGRAEQVFVDAYPMHQVMKRELLSPGSFFADEEGKRLYVWIADNSVNLTPSKIENLMMEGSTRSVLWLVKGDYVRTSGITFRYAANPALTGAATFAGNHSVVENCTFERANGDGARFEGQRIVVQNCAFIDNGYNGFEAARAHDLLFTGCLVRNNNTKNFDRGWGGGADKIVLSRDVVIEKSRFIENRGVGLWFDIGNENCTVRNCLIADNEGAGLFYEISYGLHAHDNVILGNGFAGGAGAWGVCSGITLSSSPNCVVERNLIIGNAEGLNFREQLRTTPRITDEKAEVAIWNHDQTIQHNMFAYNGVQVWGWFAVGDGRHWPKAKKKDRSSGQAAGQDIARDYVARGKSGQPVGLSLEDLQLHMRENLYYASLGQKLVNWGSAWESHAEYDQLSQVQQELGLENGSRCALPEFADYETKDFRVPGNGAAIKLGCYPDGSVPDVRLGTR